MNVKQVSVTIKYSKEEQRAWRTIELGTEASVGLNENWATQQTQLYAQLGKQLRELWRGNDAPLPQYQELEQFDSLPPVREHWCDLHQVEYRRFEKDGRTWYAHQAADRSWCREK